MVQKKDLLNNSRLRKADCKKKKFPSAFFRRAVKTSVVGDLGCRSRATPHLKLHESQSTQTGNNNVSSIQ